ncbi:MAG: flavin reductase [Bacteroidales bacterium]
MKFKEVNIEDITESIPKLIGKDWMLITSGNEDSFNTMTASWGGLGHLWHKNVAFIFIRPQRYTFEFVEREEYFTLSFFPEEYRNSLKICGTKSGRDSNKIAEAGLTPHTLSNGTITFEEARYVFVCRKIYANFINEESLLLKSDEISKIYPEKDFHKMYIGEIIAAYKH